METISCSIIRDEPGTFEKLLSKEGILVLTKRGKPLAIILDGTTEPLEETLCLVSQVRAQKALSEVRESARKRGLDKLAPEEIQAEIDAVHSARPGK